ncbi:MAG: cobalt ECF transporter T component CbiQ [Methanobacteriales archaeon Met13]
MIDLMSIERESGRKSLLHGLDGRIKIIATMLLIAYAVYSTDIRILFVIEVYLLILILISKISIGYAFKRIVLIIPFGGFVAILQPFIRPGDIIYTLPIGIDVTYQGLVFGILLMSRLIVCVSAIVLLSSVTSMQDLIKSARKLKIPGEFAMLLSLTVRYLFFFYEELLRIRNAQKSRCFDIWNRKTEYIWRLKKVGQTITMMFLRSYEQGEKVYLSMLSRGYSTDSHIYLEKNKLVQGDFFLITATVGLVVALEVIRYFSLI